MILDTWWMPPPGSNQKSLADFLKPEHFFSEINGEVYTAILSLLKKKAPVDMRTVVHELRSTGKLELIGGPYYIAQLTAGVSSAANIEYHARILIEFAVKRQMIAMASEIMTAGYDHATDCFELLDRATALINEANEWRKK
jgi:replicative DNA helicase